MPLKITVGCCACYQHSEDRICSPLGRLARPWRSDADREMPEPVLVLFSLSGICFFYWESDFTCYPNMMSQLLFRLGSQHGALEPAVPGHRCAPGISAGPLVSAAPLLLPLDSGFPRRTAHPQSPSLIGSQGFKSREHLTGHWVPGI